MGYAYMRQNIKSSAPKLLSNTKLRIAVDHVLSAMPKVSKEQADSIIHSMLARMNDIGATGNLATRVKE